uniref:Ribonuclease T2 n=1 Tax=Macrostomum lignano TaxID=282301 RepID=A0A1I8GQR1_9PLAT
MDLLNPKGSPLYFWREEFKKHGSCVATDPRFNTTFLYFKAALQLNQKYNLSDALQSAFGFKPMVRCAKTNGQTFLYELRLCFAKDLSPNDCNEEPQPARPFTVWGVLEKTAAQLHQMLFGWSTPGSVWLPRRSNGTYECGDGELVLLPDAAQR